MSVALHSPLHKKLSLLLSGGLGLDWLSPWLLLQVLLQHSHLIPSIFAPLIYCCDRGAQEDLAGRGRVPVLAVVTLQSTEGIQFQHLSDETRKGRSR